MQIKFHISSYQEQVTTLSLNILKLYIGEGVSQNNIILEK